MGILQGFWPSLLVLGLIVVLWIEARALGGRTTLGWSRFVTAFAYGAVGATAVAFITERIASLLVSPAMVSYTIGPVAEEIVKALPLFLLVIVWHDGRRLAISDLALLGISVGLGFQFVESNLRALVAGNVPPELHDVSWLLPGVHTATAGSVVAAGHAIWTGLIGLALGFGIRVGRPFALFLGTVALAVIAFDHVMFNWALYQDTLGYTSPASAAVPLAVIQDLTLRGRLEVGVLAIGLVAGNFVDSRTRSRLPSDFFLAYEHGSPLVILEWVVAARIGLSGGPLGLRAALTYFRQRKAYQVALANAERGRESPSYVRSLEQRLRAELADVEDAPTSPSIRMRVRPSAVASGVVANAGNILLCIALAVLFLFGLSQMAPPVSRVLFGSAPALVLGLVGIGVVAYQLRRFAAAPIAPGGDPESPIAYHLGIIVLGGSLVSAATALAGWFLPRQVFGVSPGLLFVTGPLFQWAASGGNPSAVLGAGAALVGRAVKPPDSDRCGWRRKWVNRVSKRIQADYDEIALIRKLETKYAAQIAAGGTLTSSQVSHRSMFPHRIRTLQADIARLERFLKRLMKELAACMAKAEADDATARPTAQPDEPDPPQPKRAGLPWRPGQPPVQPQPQAQPVPPRPLPGGVPVPAASKPAPGRPPKSCAEFETYVELGKTDLQRKADAVRALLSQKMVAPTASGPQASRAPALDGEVAKAQEDVWFALEGLKARYRLLANCRQQPELANVTAATFHITPDLLRQPPTE